MFYGANCVVTQYCCEKRAIRLDIAHMAGYTMSLQFLKDELSDIQEVIMVYNQAEAHRKITERSRVQEKLWHLFRLNEIEQVLLH